jgi:hypothetical protein
MNKLDLRINAQVCIAKFEGGAENFWHTRAISYLVSVVQKLKRTLSILHKYSTSLRRINESENITIYG